jgi:hypothetical protein
MKYLISTTDTYRVATVADVEALHDELLNDSHFTLAAFSYKTKYIKQKGEVIDEYQLVTAKKLFNEEKDPNTSIGINYTMEF